jgi:hypothetical protein
MMSASNNWRDATARVGRINSRNTRRMDFHLNFVALWSACTARVHDNDCLVSYLDGVKINKKTQNSAYIYIYIYIYIY